MQSPKIKKEEEKEVEHEISLDDHDQDKQIYENLSSNLDNIDNNQAQPTNWSVGEEDKDTKNKPGKETWNILEDDNKKGDGQIEANFERSRSRSNSNRRKDFQPRYKNYVQSVHKN